MNIDQGEHHSQLLSSGLQVHLVRHPGNAEWKIRSIDLSSDPRHGEFMTTKTWFAGPMGLDKLAFDSTDAACAYLERYAKVHSPAPATHS